MNLKKGLFQGCFPPSVSMDRCLQLTAELAFDGLEVTMEDPAPLVPEALNETTREIQAIGESVGMTTLREGALTFSSTRAEIEGLARQAADLGVPMPSIATMMHFFYPLSSPVPSVRDQGIALALRMLEAASLLGAGTILLVPGVVTPATGYQEVYQRSQAVIRELEPEARRRGVVMAIENVWNRFLMSPRELARYVDEFASPYVGVYFDVANILAYGYPDDWLKILGSRVRAVHFKDFRRDIGTVHGFTHLLHGDVDWPAVTAALRQIDYQGYITVEVPPRRTHPVQGIQEAKASLDLILSST